MNRYALAGLITLYVLSVALGIYEITAKSPSILGGPLPGWAATAKAEKATRWNPSTGILPVDKLLHEGEEAARFYASLVDFRS